MSGSSPGTRTYVTSNDMLHHRSDCRRKKSYVKALTEFTGRDTARGCKRNGELYYRLQIHPSHIYSGDG